jgi:hypothetical protein
MPFLLLDKPLFVAGSKFPAGPREIGGKWAKLLMDAGAKGITEKEYQALQPKEIDDAIPGSDADNGRSDQESAFDSLNRHKQGRPYRRL